MVPSCRLAWGVKDCGTNDAGSPEQSWLLIMKRGVNWGRSAASKASLRPSWSVSCAGACSARPQIARSKRMRVEKDAAKSGLAILFIANEMISQWSVSRLDGAAPTSQKRDVGHLVCGI